MSEVDSAGTFTHFVYAGSQNGAPDFLIRSGVLLRVVKDHLGSVRAIVNVQSGAVLQAIEYVAFGVVLRDTNPGFQPFGFAGGLYDADTGLVRFGARDYDASVGRWTNKDPIGFAGQQGNQYLYVGGDPVNRIDPTGRSTVYVETTVADSAVVLGVGMLGLSWAGASVAGSLLVAGGANFWNPVGWALVAGGGAYLVYDAITEDRGYAATLGKATHKMNQVKSSAKIPRRAIERVQ